jgi:RHS repeat-associated protein
MYDKDGAKVLEKGTRYSYDKNGNQTEETASYVSPRQTGVSETYKGSVSGEGVVSVDNNGDQIEKTIQTTESKYDGFNRLVSADVTSGSARTIANYDYNGDDLRVGKTVASSDKGYKKESTEYVYSGSDLVLELNGSSDSADTTTVDASGTVKARYVKGINYVARLDDKGNSSYICYNGHGDVVETVGAENGQVENKYDYDEFGNATLTQEKYSMDIRYAGYQFDEETGSYYLKARYYDPYVGRFTTEDTYTGQNSDTLSLNLYTYCENEPIDCWDIDGHEVMESKQINKEKKYLSVIYFTLNGVKGTENLVSTFQKEVFKMNDAYPGDDYNYLNYKDINLQGTTEGIKKNTKILNEAKNNGIPGGKVIIKVAAQPLVQGSKVKGELCGEAYYYVEQKLNVYTFTNLDNPNDDSEDDLVVYEDPNHKGYFNTDPKQVLIGKYQEIVHKDDDGNVVSVAKNINGLKSMDQDAGDEQTNAWLNAGVTTLGDVFFMVKGVKYGYAALKEAGLSKDMLIGLAKEAGKSVFKNYKPSIPKEASQIPGTVASASSYKGDISKIIDALKDGKYSIALGWLKDLGLNLTPIVGSGKAIYEAKIYNYAISIKNMKSSDSKKSGTNTNKSSSKTSSGGTKTSSVGTKTSSGGTKTSSGGTKTSSGGTKTSSGGSNSVENNKKVANK